MRPSLHGAGRAADMRLRRSRKPTPLEAEMLRVIRVAGAAARVDIIEYPDGHYEAAVKVGRGIEVRGSSWPVPGHKASPLAAVEDLHATLKRRKRRGR